jgi:hypothetical protein
MLFPEASKAIAESMVMLAKIQGMSLVEYIDSLSPPDTSPEELASSRRVFLSLIGEKYLTDIPQDTTN